MGPEEELEARADSFVVETNVHFPADVSLLWDALRSLLGLLPPLCAAHGAGAWRQAAHWARRARRAFQGVRAARQRRGKAGRKRVREYLRVARQIVERSQRTLGALEASGASEAKRERAEGWLGHARRQIDQMRRRVLEKETIPHGEKVFSIFEEHTRWCVKGKAGVVQRD